VAKVVTLADDIRALPKELGQKKFGLDWVYLTLTCPAKLIQAGLEDSTFAVVRSPVNGPFTTYQYRLKRFNTRGRISARPMPDRIPAGAARCEKIPVAERRAARRARRFGAAKRTLARALFCYSDHPTGGSGGLCEHSRR